LIYSPLSPIGICRQGYEAQQTAEPVEANRVDNLGEPVSGDHGAHGSFAARSRHWSSQFWATKNRKWLALAGVCPDGHSFRSLEKIHKQKRVPSLWMAYKL